MIWRRWRPVVAAMAVTAALLAGCAGTIGGTAERAAAPVTVTSPGASAGSGSSAGSGTAAGSGSSTGSGSSAASSPAGRTITRVGDTVTIDGIEYSGTKIAVTLVEIIDPVSSDSPPPDGGAHYAGIQFRIKNVGTTTYQDAPALELSVTDDRHQQYQLALVSRIDAGQLLPASLDVAVGDSVVGFAAVELPAGAHIAKVAYSAGAGGQIAYWTIDS